MKKLFVICGLITGSLFFSQELNDQMKGMLQYDNIEEFGKYVKKEDVNKCFIVKGESYSLLAISIKLGSEKFFQKLIEEKADLDLICDNKSPLMFAAKYGKAHFAKTLLQNGADKMLKSTKGQTALDYAKKYEQTEMVEILK